MGHATQTAKNAEVMALLWDELRQSLIYMADLQFPNRRGEGLDTVMVNFFFVKSLTIGDALEVLQQTVKRMLTAEARLPGPDRMEAIKKVYGDGRVPLSLGHGRGLGADPLATRLDAARKGEVYRFGNHDDAAPYVDALIGLFKHRELTVREVLAVIAKAETGLLDSPLT